MKTYNVYCIKNRLSTEIVYVGLTGSTLYKRFNSHVHRRKISPKDYYIQMIQGDLTLPEAVTLERMLIAQYDLLSIGWNKSPGSINGCSNNHSEVQKTKWSEERKNKPFPNRQDRTTPNSKSHNKLISEANSKPIICLNDGSTYRSQREAALKLGLSESKLSKVLNNKRPHTKGYKFKYL